MRYIVRIFLFLIILGIIFVGCYLKLDAKVKTEQYTVQIVPEEMERWIVIGENVLPQIPGRIYVQKTESRADIWHTACSVANSETGGGCSVEGSELSERQRLNLLNTGAVPRGWEVVYVDEDGNPVRKE